MDKKIEDYLRLTPEDYERIKPFLKYMYNYLEELKEVVDQRFVDEEGKTKKESYLIGIRNQQSGLVRLAQAYSGNPQANLTQKTLHEEYLEAKGMGLATDYLTCDEPIEETIAQIECSDDSLKNRLRSTLATFYLLFSNQETSKKE